MTLQNSGNREMQNYQLANGHYDQIASNTSNNVIPWKCFGKSILRNHQYIKGIIFINP